MKKVFTGHAYGLTQYYHSDGGFVVIAENEDEARRKVAEYAEEKRDDRYGENDFKVTRIEEIGVANEGVDTDIWIYPDAGCC